MADTPIINLVSPLTGTVASNGLTDPNSRGSIVAGNLRVITGTGNGFGQEGIIPTGYSGLFPTATIQFNSDSMGTATPYVSMRGQADNTKLFVSCSKSEVLSYWYDTAFHQLDVPTIRQIGEGISNLTGVVTLKVQSFPDVGGTTSLSITILNAGTTYKYYLNNMALGPLVAGSCGVGVYGTAGTIDFTQLTITDNPAAKIAPKTKAFFGIGDSIGVGYGIPSPEVNNHYNLTGPKNGPEWDVYNLSASGQHTAMLAVIEPNIQAILAQNAYAISELSVMIGTNNGAGTDAAIVADIKSFVAFCKAAGIKKTAVGTILPREGAVAYAAANTSIKNGDTLADRVTDYASAAGLNDSTSNNYQSDQLHPSTAGHILMANLDAATLALDYPASSSPPATDPYRSDNATPVTILADYKPGAPNPFAGTGLGTFLLPTVVLTWINPANLLGGTIHIMRMNAGTSDPFVVVGTVAGADANTAPAQTYTDTTVLNGHRYTYTAFATPYGDTTTP